MIIAFLYSLGIQQVKYKVLLTYLKPCLSYSGLKFVLR